MEAVSGSWLFPVFMGVIALILIIMAIRELWKRRNKPINPEDKYTGRTLIKDLIKSIFG